jgi:hypothetical protein
MKSSISPAKLTEDGTVAQVIKDTAITAAKLDPEAERLEVKSSPPSVSEADRVGLHF